MTATDLPVQVDRGGAGGSRIRRALGELTPTGRASVPLSWALYDFANTIYSYAVVSYAIGLWSVNRLGPSDGQFWVLFAGAVSVLLNALVSPVLGAMSDRTGGRMKYLLFFTGMTVVASAAIALTDSAAIGLTLFAVANFGYQAALIYYDATLPLVARPGARGRVSGIGVAVGYLGTIVIAILILVLDSKASGLTFLLAAALFAIFSIPIFRVVREAPRPDAVRLTPRDVIRSWAQVGTTIRDARAVPGLGRFLLGRFFYTDPVNTVIVIMSVFAVKAIGISESLANVVLLILTVVAVAASFGWGQLVERIGPKRTLLIVLGTWCVGLVIVGSVLSLPTFLLGGALLGAGLGGVWTSDRVFMLRLSPPDKVGEFFGLYGIAGKFSAVSGPLLYGVIVSTLLDRGWGAGAYQVGIFSFLILLLIGVWLLRGVTEPPVERAEVRDEGAVPPPERLAPATAPLEPG
ncbi:MAG TPA: MFS transporter [Candidatus Limnocylindrales bacterium]|nr:MFS transporter [Candidatus Limnocylindrales bacterium]